MSCPSCGYLLQKLSVSTDSGGKFDVEHCGRCGGTWFDPYEINRIPYHEITRIAKLTVLPHKQPELLPTRLCPRCHTLLNQFNGESIPAGIQLLRCNQCKGIWASQKALEVFKEYQQKTIKEYKFRKTAFPALSVVFVPALFIALLFVSTYITVTNLQKSKEERIQATAEISRLQTVAISPTKVSVTFKTKTALKAKISYGTSSFERVEKIISPLPQTDHKILLTDLAPGTAYLYRITLTDEKGRSIATPLGSFTTIDK